ncbi:cold shock domain-containing protein [Kordia sp.]|uniref:cold shock domain-containing protein n=1 Tax=Kordia sp. TaxID=1965332 RepID=UPI003D6ABAF5
MKESGIIKWFDTSKGFGVIITPTNGEYFIHKSNIQDKSLELTPKTPVVFKPDFEKNKKTAKNCNPPKNTDDLFTILLLSGNNQTVSIKTKIKGTSRWGNPYIRDEFISYNVVEISLNYIFNKKSESDLFALVTDAYIQIKDTIGKFDYNNLFQVITKHINQLQIEDSSQFIDKCYRFFGENLSEGILFSIWKSKNFHFISKSEFEDYEIPEKILLQNVKNLTVDDLERIKEYEDGDNSCYKIVIEKIKEISNQTPFDTIIETYKFIEVVKDNSKKERLLDDLNEILYKNSLNEINVRLNELPPISDKTILSKYNNLKQLIPTEISEKQKVELSKIISETIINKSSELVKTDLWLSGYIDKIENTQIVELLCNENIQINDKLKAIEKTHNSDQIILILEGLLDKQKSQEIFELIEQFVKQENELGYYFELKSAIETGDFGDDKIGYNLLKTFQTIIKEKTTKEEQTKLFFEGWLDNYPPDYILFIAQNLTEEELRKILKNNYTEGDYLFKLLETKSNEISNKETNWFLKLSQEFLSIEDFEKIDNLLIDQTTDEIWFKLWENKATKILRKEYLVDYLDDEQSKYKKIHKWINSDIISKEKISEFLYEKLEQKTDITDRIEFYTAFNIIQKLIELDSKWADGISSLKNNFFNLLLWHLDITNNFDFDTLKGKFIYFKPIDQVYIFKRLFYLKHTKKIDFTFKELDEIVRADVDLFLTNEKINNDFVLDISTHILIEAIKSYQTKNNFLFESDLILKDLKNNSRKKFKIENYFEDCPGRLTADWNWKTNGNIKKNSFPNDNERFYYSIEFETAFPREGNNYYGSYTYFEKNPMFETLKDDVKKITGRKWNPDKKHWGVPSSSESEVFEFAKRYRFFIDLGNKKHYDNNTHLVEYSRDEKPIGISFCEGRKSNKKHNKLNCEFWWCTNQPCFQFAEIDHLSDNFSIPNDANKKRWEYYKLIDILRVLNINTDEKKETPVDFIPDGNYYKFIGHINAFNRLIDKLYCHSCDELLYPTETSHFALYRDTKFHCVNDNCSEHNKTIYLNHCLNGECNNIIDSRISKTCNNGLYICDSCGSCCSDAMFRRRLDNLKLVGSYTHPELVRNVQEENGHLEKAEYYCFKCKGMMMEINDKKYECKSCNVSYDLKNFKWLDRKWNKKNQRRSDYPIYRRNDDYNEPF